MTRDSYAGEDDDPLSLHLYTYCGNDGVNNIDFDGHNPLALWSSTAWWLCAIDGPLPVGDVIYASGIAVTGVITVAATYETAKYVTKGIKYGENTETYIDNTAKNKRASISTTTVISLNRKINTNRFRELGFVVGIPRIFVNSGKLNYVYNVGARNISKAELDNRLEKLIKSESKSEKSEERKGTYSSL